MRIALIAPLYEAVPPPLYGGTERVIAALADELCRTGHHVTLFAAAGSDTRAELVECASAPLRMSMSRVELEQIAPHQHLKMLRDVYARADDFDIIHSHTDIWTLPFMEMTNTPTLITMHGRLDLDSVRRVFPMYPHAPLASISDSQRLALDDLDVNWIATCYNGLDLRTYGGHDIRSHEYLAFVGRITPEKRPDWAIEVARRTGWPLKIAAKVDPLDQDYWTDVIEPLVDAEPLVTFLGEIGEDEKPAFFAGAAATLFPIDWPEPFGLVMIESLAAGTPVIAMTDGSVPEILAHEQTGFMCESVDEMVAAVGRITTISRDDCAIAAQRFSASAMATQYLAAYADVIRRSKRRTSSASHANA